MGPTALQLQTAWKVTTWDGRTPFFSQGEICYRYAEYQPGITTIVQNAYRIIGVAELHTASNGDILDGNDAVADGSASANYKIDGASNTTNIKWPTFYKLQNVNKPTIVIEAHEATLKNLAGLKAAVDLIDDTWVDPT